MYFEHFLMNICDIRVHMCAMQCNAMSGNIMQFNAMQCNAMHVCFYLITCICTVRMDLGHTAHLSKAETLSQHILRREHIRACASAV